MFPAYTEMPFTYTICTLVILMSIIGFYHKPFYQFFIYHPYEVFRGKRVHTVFTSAFVHKNWWHLVFNIYIFYGVNRDIEYIILEDDFGQATIKFICLLVVALGIILPNLFLGIKHRNNLSFTSVGFSGATFCSMGFCMLYLPLDVSPKIYFFFPFLHYAYEFGLFALVVFYIMSLVFKNPKTTNHKLHVNALVIGCLLAIVIRPKLIVEIITHLENR